MMSIARLRSAPVSNAAYGIADYASLPVLMLCSAPFLLHHLGVEQYAIWLLASAAVTGGTLLSAGFGDAAVKYIAARRGAGDHAGVELVIRTLLAINLTLGAAVAALIGVLLPVLVAHLPHANDATRVSYQRALAIGCLLLVVKSVESVFICTQRAYERYDVAARFSIATRVATIGAAVVIAALGGGTATIIFVTLLVGLASLGLQMRAAWRYLSLRSLWPSWNRAAIAELFSFGCFSWLQGFIGLLSGQADRFLVGYLLGTQALAYYSICVQMSLPIHGIAAAGLQVLFPYLAARLGVLNMEAVRRKFAVAFAANVAIVAVLASPLILFGHSILRLWLGEDFAAHASAALSIMALGFALLGLNVSGYFVLMALGRIRVLVLVNGVAAVVMLLAIAVLAPRLGLVGAALGRLVYGPMTWIAYSSLRSALRTPQGVADNASAILGAA